MTTISFISDDQNKNSYPLLQKLIKHNKSRSYRAAGIKIFEKFVTDPNLRCYSNDSIETDNNHTSNNNFENKTISLPKYTNIQREIRNFERNINSYFIPFKIMSLKFSSLVSLKLKNIVKNHLSEPKEIETNKNETLKDIPSKGSYRENKNLNIFLKYNKNNINNTTKNLKKKKDYISFNKIKLKQFAKLPKGIENVIFNKKNINKINDDQNNIQIIFNRYYNRYKKLENKKKENKKSSDKIYFKNTKFSPDKKGIKNLKDIIIKVNRSKSEKKEKDNRKFIKRNTCYQKLFFQDKNNNNFGPFITSIDESKK